jgi:GINS complex subunit 1
MNYGQRGVDLLRELKRSDWLPSYNEDGVRATLQEINLHTEELQNIVRANNRVGGNDTSSSTAGGGAPVPIEMRPVMLLHEVSIKRNKRCLLAYHAHRIDKLRALRWETAGSLSTPMKFVLSEAEIDFFHEYDKLASRHAIGSMGGGLDWNADQNPPEENFIQVRVVQSGLGKIETELCGVVDLEVGSMHYLPRSDVEHLVRQGALVQLGGEESF